MGRWSGGTYDNGDGTWSTVVSDENGNTSSSGSAVTQYADNTAHSSGDTGMYILVVRQDVAASLTSADGRKTGLTVDSLNQLRVTMGAISASNDAISAHLATDSIRNGTTALTPKFAAIAAATSGANTLVAAVTSKKIRVLSLCLVAGAAGNVYFTSAAAGTVIFGGSTNKIQLAANGGFVLPFSPLGWFETVAGELLNMNASSTGPFSGGLTYVEV